jgi:hypothetical protein
LVEVFQGQDAVVSTIGGNALSTQTTIIDAAIKAGVRRFLPSEFGNDSDSAKGLEMVPFFQPKKVVLDYARAKQDELSFTAIETGVFFDWVCIRRVPSSTNNSLTSFVPQAMKVGFLGFDLKSSTATIWDDGDKHFCGTLIEKVGEAIATALLKPEETKNQVLYVASVDTTQNDMLAALEAHSGSKWTVNKTTVAEQHANGMAAMQKGDIMGAVGPLILSGVFSGHGADFQGSGHKLDNAVLDMPPPSLEMALKPVFEFFDKDGVAAVPDFNPETAH